MALTPINGDLTAGVAGKRTETLNAYPDPFVTGDVPMVLPYEEVQLTNQVLAARTVVGLDLAGKIVPAVLGTTEAVGILVYATDSTGADKACAVYRQGCFNPDLCVWDATYDTDAKKRKAFEGAPSPTAIVIRKPQTMTTV